MEKLRIGILGVGYTIGVARNHADAIAKNPRAELTAIYDIVPGRAAEWKAKNNLPENVAACDTPEQFYGLVDAVDITVPNAMHVAEIEKALEAGKHVICEKPLSVSVAEAQKAVDCHTRHKNLTAVMVLNYIDWPAFKWIKDYMDSGKMGRLFASRHILGGSRIANPEGVRLEWRMQEILSGTGALADFGVHMLYLADNMYRKTQGEICEICAMTATRITERYMEDRPDVKAAVTNDDCAAFSAKTENGALLSFMASRVGSFHRLEVIGEGGMIIYEGNNNRVLLQEKDKKGGYGGRGDFAAFDIPEEFRGENGHEGVVNQLVDGVLDGKPVTKTFEMGVYYQKILDACKESAAAGHVIRLK